MMAEKTDSAKKRGRPTGKREKESRDAALYDAYIALNGKNGRASVTGFTTYFANKYGISRQAVDQAIKREAKRREDSHA